MVAVAMRAYHLGTQSLWVDELGEGTTARDAMGNFVTDVHADFGAAPLDYLGVKLFTSVLGYGTVATRAWAFVMGCFGVLMMYPLAGRFFKDRATALIATGLLALSAFDIYYSQEARFYALAVVMGSLQLYTFMRALDGRRVRDWAVYGAVTAVALYSHLFLAALLPTEGIYLAAATVAAGRRGQGGRPKLIAGARQVGLCLAAQVLAFATFAPWLISVLAAHATAGYPVLPALTLSRIHQIFVVLIAMAPLNSTHPSGVGQLLRTDLVLGLAAVGLGWELFLRRWRALLLAAIIAVLIPLAWWSDQVQHYFWAERQVIFVLVPLYLLAAAGLGHLLRAAAGFASRWEWIRAPSPRTTGAIAGALFVVLVVGWAAVFRTPITLVYTDRWAVKEDWRSAAAYIDRYGCPGAQYWSFLNAHYSYGVAYYDPSLTSRSHSLFELPGGGYTDDPLTAVAAQHVGTSDWLIISDALATTEAADGATYDSKLRALGWSVTHFTGLAVYHQSTCGGP